MRNGARVEATARVDGKTAIVATGRIRDHKLKLTIRHLERGRYKLTLLELGAHHGRQMIGHTSLEIS